MGKEIENPDDFSFKPFKNLSEVIRNKGFQLSKKELKTDDALSDEELFIAAMREVKEIKEFRNLAIESKKRPQKLHKLDPDQEILDELSEIVKGKGRINLRDTQEYVEWFNPKYANIYRKDLAKKLHEGAFSVQDYLDMHGMTLEDAEIAVETFINDSLIKEFRCIKFIHGRGLRSPTGEAVLKNALIKWLMGRYHKHVIALATAPYNNGGLGALYVLLRKRKSR